MNIESLQGYLVTKLPLQRDPIHHFRLLRSVFLLVFASALVIHLLVALGTDPLRMLVHATAIGLVYVAGVWLAAAMLFSWRDAARGLRVWHVWVISSMAFLFGYFLLPFDGWLGRLPGFADSGHDVIGFAPLLPIWCLVTYLFIQPYLNEGLRVELGRLRELNELLERHHGRADEPDPQLIRFEAGRTEFALPAETIRNIAVEDHYCYVHYLVDDGYHKRDLAMPLRDVIRILPPGFLRVHRSHVVNPDQVVAIRRRGRNLRLVLQGNHEVPVSRHRLDDVLPTLRRRLS